MESAMNVPKILTSAFLQSSETHGGIPFDMALLSENSNLRKWFPRGKIYRQDFRFQV